jgi:hypothetical protein
MVPHGQPYRCSHDIVLVGKMVDQWAKSNRVELDVMVRGFVAICKGAITGCAASILTHAWLGE